jgi:hypothetical protein
MSHPRAGAPESGLVGLRWSNCTVNKRAEILNYGRPLRINRVDFAMSAFTAEIANTGY